MVIRRNASKVRTAARPAVAETSRGCSGNGGNVENLKVDLRVQAMPAHRAPSRRPKRGALTALTAQTPAVQLTSQTSETSQTSQTSCHCWGRASQARELGFGVVERGAQPAEQFVDLLFLDDQRRRDDGVVAGHAHDHPVIEHHLAENPADGAHLCPAAL